MSRRARASVVARPPSSEQLELESDDELELAERVPEPSPEPEPRVAPRPRRAPPLPPFRRPAVPPPSPPADASQTTEPEAPAADGAASRTPAGARSLAERLPRRSLLAPEAPPATPAEYQRGRNSDERKDGDDDSASRRRKKRHARRHGRRSRILSELRPVSSPADALPGAHPINDGPREEDERVANPLDEVSSAASDHAREIFAAQRVRLCESYGPDLWIYMKNSHPFLGLCAANRHHQYRRGDRFLVLAVALLVALLLCGLFATQDCCTEVQEVPVAVLNRRLSLAATETGIHYYPEAPATETAWSTRRLRGSKRTLEAAAMEATTDVQCVAFYADCSAESTVCAEGSTCQFTDAVGNSTGGGSVTERCVPDGTPWQSCAGDGDAFTACPTGWTCHEATSVCVPASNYVCYLPTTVKTTAMALATTSDASDEGFTAIEAIFQILKLGMDKKNSEANNSGTSASASMAANSATASSASSSPDQSQNQSQSPDQSPAQSSASSASSTSSTTSPSSAPSTASSGSTASSTATSGSSTSSNAASASTASSGSTSPSTASSSSGSTSPSSSRSESGSSSKSDSASSSSRGSASTSTSGSSSSSSSSTDDGGESSTVKVMLSKPVDGGVYTLASVMRIEWELSLLSGPDPGLNAFRIDFSADDGDFATIASSVSAISTSSSGSQDANTSFFQFDWDLQGNTSWLCETCVLRVCALDVASASGSTDSMCIRSDGSPVSTATSSDERMRRLQTTTTTGSGSGNGGINFIIVREAQACSCGLKHTSFLLLAVFIALCIPVAVLLAEPLVTFYRDRQVFGLFARRDGPTRPILADYSAQSATRKGRVVLVLLLLALCVACGFVAAQITTTNFFTEKGAVVVLWVVTFAVAAVLGVLVYCTLVCLAIFSVRWWRERAHESRKTSRLSEFRSSLLSDAESDENEDAGGRHRGKGVV